MLRSIIEMEAQRVLVFIHYHGMLGQSHFGRGRITDVGQKNVLPNRRAARGLRVLHIENVVGKILIKDPRLHFKGSLRALQ